MVMCVLELSGWEGNLCTSKFSNTERKPEKMAEIYLNQHTAQNSYKLLSPEECLNRQML